MSSTSLSTTTFQLLVNALGDYLNQTAIDLSQNPLAEKIQLSNTPNAILEILEEREKAFKEYRDGNRRLITCLSPAVRVLHAFSATLGEAIGLFPFSPAKAIIIGIDVLLAAASDVTSSYDALLELFECLGSFLKRLEIYINIPPTQIMTDILAKIMAELLSVLAMATKQLKQGRFRKFAKKLLGEGEVEAVLRRLDRLTQDEARVTVAQTLGIVHGLVNNMKIVMEDGKTSTESTRQTLVSLQQVVCEMNRMKRDQLQRDVQHWLSPPDPLTNHDIVWKAHHTGTAAWFFETDALSNWKPTGSLLWIHGKPGSGKSTLLSAIIQDLESLRVAGLATVAYYYFDFRDVKKQDRYGLLSSLLSQLSAESDTYYEILSRLYSNNAGGARKPTSNALTACMKDKLSIPKQGQIYIIIDALDECPNISGTLSAREEVLGLVEDLVCLNLPNAHLCVTSCPEVDIRRVFEPLTSLQISLHDEGGQKQDIINYIKSVVHSDWNMRKWREEDRQLVVDVLSEKADGMFRWVVCQIDRLRRSFPASIRRILNDLPKSLDETYGQTLLGIDEEKGEYAQRLFRCLTVSIRPLRVEELAEIFAVSFNEADAPTFNLDWRPVDAHEAVLSACSSLISVVDVSGSKIVQFSHFSVKEFLTSERLADAGKPLSCYHILPEPAHTTLACACLSTLLQLDDKIDKSGIRHFPLASYAARYWVDRARFKSVSLQVQDLTKHLFNPMKPHFAAWVWLYDVDHHWLDSMSKSHPTRPSAVPLYYASLCGLHCLVERIIITHPQDVNARGGLYNTPLHAASVKGHLEVVQLLLDNNADPNSGGNDGLAPLHSAARRGHLEVVTMLLGRGVDVNQKKDDGWTPLHLASTYGRLEMVRFLIQHGAGVDILNGNQETPLYRAAANGNLEVTQFLLNSGANVNTTNGDGWTPLHVAAKSGYRDVPELLLGSGASPDARDMAHATPLTVACAHGRLEVAHLLLGCGSDVNSQDKKGRTPLHFASRRGHVDIARLLIDRGANVNAHHIDRSTPLHIASVNGHLDIAQLLTQHGANVDSLNDKEETPLDQASGEGYLEIACFLVGHGAAVSSRNKNGWTPFHKASIRGHLPVIKFLLESGVDIDVRNGKEETSLELASGSGKLDVVHFLIDKGADIHARDADNSNPLHLASQNGHLDVVQLLISAGTTVDVRNSTQKTPLALAASKGQVKVSRFLIESGADINVRDDEGLAPLHLASRHGHMDMTRLLLDCGVDPNTQTDHRSSSLHMASVNGHLDVAKLLILRGAVVDAPDDEQRTPLGQAALHGNLEIARLLIDHGANLHTTESNGWTPLHLASKEGHLDVVRLLLWRGGDVDVLDKTNKTVTELASENGNGEIASFLAEYKTRSDIRNKVRSASFDTTRHGTDEYGKDKARKSLHTASKGGKLDVVKSLLNQGADVNATDTDDATPLHLAAIEGNLDVVSLLLERGAEVDSRDWLGQTPLLKASRSGHVEISRVLIDHGANVNAKKYNYWTPIHNSAYNGYLGIVELLLEHGADVHALNDEGQTAYQLSLRKGHRKIADLLREHDTRRP